MMTKTFHQTDTFPSRRISGGGLLHRYHGRNHIVRKGFTLIEVVLIIGLMVIISAMVSPNIKTFFARQKLITAADQIRSSWNRARTDAIKTGNAQIFLLDTNSGQFRVTATSDDGTGSSDSKSADDLYLTSVSQYGSDNSADSPLNTIPGTKNKLPMGITCSGIQKTDSTRDENTEVSTVSVEGMSPVFFYPDGTTSTVRVILRDNRGRGMEICLRGATGMATSRTIESVMGNAL